MLLSVLRSARHGFLLMSAYMCVILIAGGRSLNHTITHKHRRTRVTRVSTNSDAKTGNHDVPTESGLKSIVRSMCLFPYAHACIRYTSEYEYGKNMHTDASKHRCIKYTGERTKSKTNQHNCWHMDDCSTDYHWVKCNAASCLSKHTQSLRHTSTRTRTHHRQ